VQERSKLFLSVIPCSLMFDLLVDADGDGALVPADI
jgi:hypothetical protein